jgi:leader peptidase (prepilin peptidase)/N-methyltransferase
VLTPIAILLGILGAAWGFVADRIGARWPAHDDGRVRPIDWRTPVAVVTGALALGGLTARFAEPVPAVVFGAYLVALVLLLATDLDQRLLPDVITLPAIPLALVLDLLGLNPLVPPGVLPIAIVVAIAVPGLMYLISVPFGAGAFGQGDVKLLVSVGLLAGPFRMFSGVVYGALLAGVVIVALLALRRITLKSYIPFGPFLIFGAVWAILAIP